MTPKLPDKWSAIDYINQEKKRFNEMAAQSVLESVGIQGPELYSPYSPPSHSLRDLVFMRLRITTGNPAPFPFFQAYQINPERVVVFLVHNNQPVVIEDDGHLFPSDTLITQLRMMLG